jgi:hypothetical protein
MFRHNLSEVKIKREQPAAVLSMLDLGVKYETGPPWREDHPVSRWLIPTKDRENYWEYQGGVATDGKEDFGRPAPARG